jgi:hypothetical protein
MSNERKGKTVWLHRWLGRDDYTFTERKGDGMHYAISFDIEKWTGFKLKPGECRRVRIKIEEL